MEERSGIRLLGSTIGRNTLANGWKIPPPRVVMRGSFSLPVMGSSTTSNRIGFGHYGLSLC